MKISTFAPLAILLALIAFNPALAQEESLRPGANDKYQTQEAERFVKFFENANRDVVKNQDALVEICKIEAGMTVADIGAGSGLFTRLFAHATGPDGKVMAVDITPNFIKHIEATCKDEGIENVVCVQNTVKTCELDDASVDIVFCCDTYHHFEFPYEMLSSIRKAMKDDGRFVLVDMIKRKTGGHVRADKETVIAEAKEAGFELAEDSNMMEKTQIVLVFKKASK